MICTFLWKAINHKKFISFCVRSLNSSFRRNCGFEICWNVCLQWEQFSFKKRKPSFKDFVWNQTLDCFQNNQWYSIIVFLYSCSIIPSIVILELCMFRVNFSLCGNSLIHRFEKETRKWSHKEAHECFYGVVTDETATNSTRKPKDA